MNSLLAEQKPVIEPLVSQLYAEKNILLSLLRLDQIHPQLSGNKWFKLKDNLLKAQSLGQRVISFGGAYSNHLHALAWAGRQLDIPVLAIVRGEPEAAHNPTLSDAAAWGMEFKFVDRQTYRQRHSVEYQQSVLAEYPNSMLIPEGGSNAIAVKGFARLLKENLADHLNTADVLVSACGTGGTLAGLIASVTSATQVLGIPVLKQGLYLKQTIEQLLNEAEIKHTVSWQLDLKGHYGGYAKLSPQLLGFIDDFETQHQIELEPIYTGKMLMRLDELIKSNYFPANTHIVAVHTGGLQAKRGFLL